MSSLEKWMNIVEGKNVIQFKTIVREKAQAGDFIAKKKYWETDVPDYAKFVYTLIQEKFKKESLENNEISWVNAMKIARKFDPDRELRDDLPDDWKERLTDLWNQSITEMLEKRGKKVHVNDNGKALSKEYNLSNDDLDLLCMYTASLFLKAYVLDENTSVPDNVDEVLDAPQNQYPFDRMNFDKYEKENTKPEGKLVFDTESVKVYKPSENKFELFVNDRAVGHIIFSDFRRSTKSYYGIVDVYIHPEYRSKGYGILFYYIPLLQEKNSIIVGAKQTPMSQKLWVKLFNHPRIDVYATDHQGIRHEVFIDEEKERLTSDTVLIYNTDKKNQNDKRPMSKELIAAPKE